MACRFSRFCTSFLCTFVVCLLPGVGHAAADWPVARGPSHEPVPYRYDAKQWQQVPKAFLEDAPACTLYSATSYLLEDDGTTESITHEITRFNGRKGIDKRGEYRNITYEPSYEKLTLNEARVLKADGRFVPVEPKHVQLRDLGTDYQVYNREKQLVISFPNLEVGDAIEVKWTTRGKNPEYRGHFFARYSFGDDEYPVVLDELRVRLPKTVLLNHATAGDAVELAIQAEGAFRTFHWRASNRAALPHDDNSPSKESMRLQVACSTFPTWAAVGQWKRQLRQECWTCTEEMRTIVRNVTRTHKTPTEKARALTNWVRRHIRYVSAGEKHDYTPHAPATVLANRYGDCKDQTQLLAVMLREAGIAVGLATLGALDDGQVLETVPSPWGTHAILLVTIDGKQHWIDTTSSLSGWDFLPRDDRNRLCYVVDDHGLRLMRTPHLEPEANRIEQTTHVYVGADGSTRDERLSRYHGLAAMTARNDWTEVPPGERRRLMTAELQDANSRARLRSLAIDETQLQDLDQPVVARLLFEVPGQFRTDNEGSFTDSPVWSKLLSITLDYDRLTSLELGSPFESIHHYSLHLPPSFRFSTLPKDKKVMSKWGSFQLSVRSPSSKSHQLDLEFHTRLELGRVDPADFEAFRKFHDEVMKDYRVWVTLDATTNLADAPALEALLALTPGDKAAAEALARLYLHHERKDEARRVLHQARFYHPDNNTLWQLTVTAAADAKEEEAAQRELVRRYPDDPKYALALGEVLVKNGKHAEAQKVLSAIDAKAPASVRGLACYQLARSCLMQKEPQQALKHLTAASKADADTDKNVEIVRFKGRVCEALKQPKQAVAAYQQTLSLDVNDEEALEALIRLALALKRPADALEPLRRYSVVVGDDVVGLARAADFHLRLGRYEDAFDLASRAREENFHALAQRTLGLVYAHRGDGERAVFHLERADLDAQVLEQLIRGYLSLGNLHKAEEETERTDKVAETTIGLCQACALTAMLVQRRAKIQQETKIPPGKVDTWKEAIDACVCAEQAYADGRSAQQVAHLLKAASKGGVQLGPVSALRGLMALEKGQLTKALADAERAVILSPKEARGFYVRGRIRWERNDAQALTDLVRAAELSQQRDSSILHWLALAQQRAGHDGEALATQRQAVKLRPNDPELREQLREYERAAKNAGASR